MTPQEKAAELMHRYQMEMGVTTYDILMEMAQFMTDKACDWMERWFIDSKYYTPQEVLDSLRKALEE